MKVIVGESRTFRGGIDWLREIGVEVIDLGSTECEKLLAEFIERYPDIWSEDIGEGECRPEL
jgi:cytosine deaminase